MTRPLLLDLYCKAGGAGRGYQLAGFDLVGVDIQPQPNYPGRFIQDDAIYYLRHHWHLYAAAHASPPCQAYTWAGKRWGKEHPDLVGPTREALKDTNLPWIMENVPGAPLVNPVTLCGEMFGLGVIRHRLFESNIPLVIPKHRAHKKPIRRPAHNDPSRTVQRSQYCTVAGHGGEGASFTLAAWQEAMGIDWMTKEELAQAIPPAYTEFLGKQLLAHVDARRAA